MPDPAVQAREQQLAKEQQRQGRDEAKLPDKEKAGPGVARAEGLLQKGIGKPDAYARVIQEFPQEKGAILGAIQKSSLGNDFAQKVVEEAGGLDLSVKDKRLSYVDKDGDDYFVADADRKGAEWQLGSFKGKAGQDGGEFSVGDKTEGKVTKEGATVTHSIDENDKIVGDVKWKDGVKGSVDWQHGDSSLGVGGSGGKGAFGADVHGKTKAGDGTVDAKLGVESKDGTMAGVGSVGYGDKDTKARLDGRVQDGKNYQAGLTGSQEVGENTLRGGAGYGAKDGTATATANVGADLKGGHSADLKGAYTDADNYQVDLSGKAKLGKETTLTGGLGYGEKDGADTIKGNLGIAGKQGSAGVRGSYTDADNHFLGADATKKLGDKDRLKASYGLNRTEGTSTHSGSLRYENDEKGNAGLSGSYTDEQNWKLGADGKYNLGKQGSLTGSVGHEVKDGAGTTSASLKGQYATDDVVLSGEGGLQHDKDGLGYNAKGEGTFTLKKGLLYGETFGGVKGGPGMDEPQYHMGGGLTLTPNEKMALTLSGAVDQSGGFDTRLQFDLFKKKVESARGLTEQRKKSVVSVFAGYRQGMDGGLMNDRYGAGKYSHDEGQAYVGVGFRF